MFLSILLAAEGSAPDAAAQQGGGMTSMLIMMAALFGVMWLFMIRPQQKKQKEIRNFQNSLEPGSKVVTGGGIYGTVRKVNLDTNKVEVEIARGVVIEVDKAYVFASGAQNIQQAN